MLLPATMVMVVYGFSIMNMTISSVAIMSSRRHGFRPAHSDGLSEA